MQFLLDAGHPVNIQNSQQRIPLLLAIECGLTSVVHLLIKQGANITAVDDDGNSVLHWCLAAGHPVREDVCLEMMQLLLDAGHSVDVQNSQQRTPFFIAIQCGFTSVVHLL
ncbi:hypothetical protein ID866_10080, partial [Astraeus odoratus]